MMQENVILSFMDLQIVATKISVSFLSFAVENHAFRYLNGAILQGQVTYQA